MDKCKTLEGKKCEFPFKNNDGTMVENCQPKLSTKMYPGKFLCPTKTNGRSGTFKDKDIGICDEDKCC